MGGGKKNMRRSVDPATLVVCATLPRPVRSGTCAAWLDGWGRSPAAVTWAADADIVDGRGQRVRPADIAPVDAGPAAASRPRPEVTVGETTIRFLTGDVAVEDGTADIVLPGTQTAIEGWFSALWVRRDGVWKLAGVRESERPVVADANMLADLDWMVGDWVVVVDEPAGNKDGGRPAAAPGCQPSARCEWPAARRPGTQFIGWRRQTIARRAPKRRQQPRVAISSSCTGPVRHESTLPGP